MEEAKKSQANLARSLLRSTDSGILSTMSTELPGYPFGSVTPYITTHDGKVVVYVSDIAQHTANMDANDKCCLTVIQAGKGNQQELGRVTFIGDAVKVPEEQVAAVQARYESFFPDARHYGQAHNFSYYWIEPTRIRYIGGFGKIFWIETDDWRLADPEWKDSENYIVEHMNQGHADALAAMARHYTGLIAERVQLIAVDVEGCHIRAGEFVAYLQFDQVCNTMGEVREVMVRMAKVAEAARAAHGGRKIAM